MRRVLKDKINLIQKNMESSLSFMSICHQIHQWLEFFPILNILPKAVIALVMILIGQFDDFYTIIFMCSNNLGRNKG